MRTCFVLVITLLIPTYAVAQGAQPRTQLIISAEAIARGMTDHPPAAAQSSSRDSVKNGAIIGGVIGAAALAIPGAVICNLLREPSDPPCWKGVATVGAIGFGVGAAAGAGIDALLLRAPSATSSTRSR